MTTVAGIGTGAAWDVVIVGGGLGGLSLAVELAQPRYAHLRVLVLEKRARYVRDRTWSYWGIHRHRYTDLERRRWHRWSVRFEGRQCVQASDIPYCTIDADAFYGAAVAQITAATHIHLRMDCAVGSVSASGCAGELPEVQLKDGRRESARWVMDARPTAHDAPTAPTAPTARTGLFQHFVGWEIRTEHDCFDDTLVELMDFESAPAGLHFFYVLPYGPRCALIETTWISPLQPSPDYEAELRAYLKSRYGLGAFECVYREHGQLALQCEPQVTASPRIVRVGQSAGTLRPSTGFAFLETVADAQRLAQCLEQENAPSARIATTATTATIAPYRRKALNRWMDRVFFQALESHWPMAPRYFMALFGGTQAHTLVPFLLGNATLRQRLKVVMQLPKADFLRAAWQSVVR